MKIERLTYTQAGVLCFVGQASAKFEVQWEKSLPAYSRNRFPGFHKII
jgi:hypothetical protein